MIVVVDRGKKEEGTDIGWRWRMGRIRVGGGRWIPLLFLLVQAECEGTAWSRMLLHLPHVFGYEPLLLLLPPHVAWEIPLLEGALHFVSVTIATFKFASFPLRQAACVLVVFEFPAIQLLHDHFHRGDA